MSLRAVLHNTVHSPITRALAVTSIATGCASGGGAELSVVGVTATDTTCTIDKSTVPSGQVRFDVANRGTVVTEVYLYAERDRVVNEVENVEPGDRATFTAEPSGGRYAVACKPGQVGDGIRAALEVTGPPASDAPSAPDRATARGLAAFTVEVELGGDRFDQAIAELVVVTGQVVTFDLANRGAAAHTLSVLAPDGVTVAGRSSLVGPGGSVSLAVTFEHPGLYTAIDALGDGTRERTVSVEVVR